MLQRLTAVFLLLLFGLTIIPGETLHHLLEEHSSEEHHCSSDLCVREKEVECSLCLYKTPKEKVYSTTNEIVVRTQSIHLDFVYISPLFSLDFTLYRNKAPPIG